MHLVKVAATLFVDVLAHCLYIIDVVTANVFLSVWCVTIYQTVTTKLMKTVVCKRGV